MKRIVLLACLAQPALAGTPQPNDCARVAYKTCSATDVGTYFLTEFEVKDCARLEVRAYPEAASCAPGAAPGRTETYEIGGAWLTNELTTSYEPGVIMYGTERTQYRYRWNQDRSALVSELEKTGDYLRTAPLANQYYPYFTEESDVRTYTREGDRVVENAVLTTRHKGVDTGNEWVESTLRTQNAFDAL